MLYGVRPYFRFQLKIIKKKKVKPKIICKHNKN